MIAIDQAASWLLAAEGGEANPLKFTPDLAIFTAIIFIVLLVVLGRFAWRPILDGLARREQRVADEIAAARQANEEAQANLRKYEDRLAAVAQEASDIVAQARKEALAVKDRIVAETSEEAQRQRQRALDEIRAAKESAVRELAERSTQTAVDLAGTILGRTLRKEDHSQLIEESINKFASKN